MLKFGPGTEPNFVSNSFGVEHSLVLMRFNELISNRLCEGLFEWHRLNEASLIDCRVVNRICTELLNAYRADGKPFSFRIALR
jgi:hypothetical protein